MGEYSNLEFTKDLWYFFKRYKLKFIFFTSLLVIVNILGLIIPLILAKIIDFFSTDYTSLNQFYFLLGILFLIGIFSTILRLKSKFHLGIFTNELMRDVKVESFQKIMQGDLIWHDKENTGNKIQRIYEGEKAIDDFMNFYINRGIKLVVNTIGIFVIFSLFSMKYSLVAVIFVLTYLLVEFKLNKKIALETLKVKIAKEKATGSAYELSSNIHTIKSLGLESSSNTRIGNYEEQVFQMKKQRRKMSNFKWISVQLIATFFYTLFIFLVGMDIVGGF